MLWSISRQRETGTDDVSEQGKTSGGKTWRWNVEAQLKDNIGQIYSILGRLQLRGMNQNNSKSSSLFSEKEFKEHLEAIQKDRFENFEEELVEAVNKCVRPQDNEILEKASTELTRNPTSAEIELTLKEMWDEALGDDGMRLRYIKLAAPAIKSKLYEVIRGMYEHRAWNWEETMKSGNILPLFKKGDRWDKNNYRGICLLPITSRVQAKTMAKRLGTGLRRWVY